MEEGLKREVRFAGKLVTVEVHRVRLSNGKEAVREVVRHPGAVVILPLLPDGKVVLVRQFRFAVGELLWELPAGTLHPGEAPLVCAQRELAEETGLRGELVPLGEFYSAPGFCNEKLHCFLAHQLQAGDTSWDEDEELELGVFTLPELTLAVAQGQIRDGKSLACLFLAQQAGFLSLPLVGSRAKSYR